MESQSAFGPFVLDRGQRRLTRGGQPVPINDRGYALLEVLLDAGGAPVSKQVLMERAWPDARVVEEGNLTVQISTLRRQLGEGADAIIVTVPRVGYRLVAKAAAAAPAALDRAGPPLVAVLPFANHGSAAEDGYFADGVVDDIITALSRFRQFGVISRGASFALRDRGADARRAAAELGVRYALEGSIRRMGDRLRLTAQLFDAASGAQLWGERYDGSTADVFTFQDHITESVVAVVEPTIRKAEIERARRKPATNLDAYDLLLRAVPLVDAPGPNRHQEAMALLRRAIELDPGFALPRAYAAWIHERRVSVRLPPLGENGRETCIADAEAALALGGDDPLVRAICGWVLFIVTRDRAGLDGLRAAVEENPNNVAILSLAGTGNRVSGALDDAYQCYARANELSPGAPEAYRFLHGLGSVEMIRGNYETAITWCLKSLATFNDWYYTHVTLTACYVNLGRMDDAVAMVGRIRSANAALTIQRIVAGAAPNDPYAAAVIPCLRAAGLPER
jgi:TolB-like protein